MKCAECKKDKSYFGELYPTKQTDKTVPFTRKGLICWDCMIKETINPEANEISDEDLMAAAEMYDRLATG